MNGPQIGDRVTYRRKGEPQVRGGEIVGLGFNSVVIATADGTKLVVPADRVWNPQQ